MNSPPQLVAAVKRDQFWILTHDSTRDAVRTRADLAVTGTNPAITLPES